MTTTVTTKRAGWSLGNTTGTMVAAVAGLLHVGLGLVGPLLTGEIDQPGWSEPRTAMTDYYTVLSFDARFVVGIALGSLSFVLVLVFVARVADMVGSRGEDEYWVGRLIIAGAVLDSALVLAYLASFAAAVHGSSYGGTEVDGTLLMNDLHFALYWIGLLALALWLAPLGVAIIRTRIFPLWIGWAAVINTFVLLGAFFMPVRAWDLATGLPFIWILVMSLLMLARPDRYVGGR